MLYQNISDYYLLVFFDFGAQRGPVFRTFQISDLLF